MKDTLVRQSTANDQQLATTTNANRLQTVTNSLSNTLSSGAPLAIAEQAPSYASGMSEAQGLITAGVTAKYGPRTTANATNWDAEAATQQADLAGTLKASAFSGHVLQVMQAQGSAAAFAEIQRFEKLGVQQGAGQPSPAAAPGSPTSASPPPPGPGAAPAPAVDGSTPASAPSRLRFTCRSRARHNHGRARQLGGWRRHHAARARGDGGKGHCIASAGDQSPARTGHARKRRSNPAADGRSAAG